MKNSKTLLDDELGKMKLLKEWTSIQHDQVKKAIKSHFRGMTIDTNNGKYTFSRYASYQYLDDIFGFAYTSSSDYAGLWVCNIDAKYPDNENYKYIGFAIREASNKPVAILWDEYENEIILPI